MMMMTRQDKSAHATHFFKSSNMRRIPRCENIWPRCSVHWYNGAKIFLLNLLWNCSSFCNFSNYIFQLVKNWTAKKDLVKSKKYVLKSKISNATSDWLWFYCGCHNYAVHLAHYSIWRVFISKNSCTFIKVELIVINASIQTNEWEISSLGCFKTSLILICKQNWRFKDTFVTFLALNQHK